jgi:hypothetical protein
LSGESAFFIWRPAVIRPEFPKLRSLGPSVKARAFGMTPDFGMMPDDEARPHRTLGLVPVNLLFAFRSYEDRCE